VIEDPLNLLYPDGKAENLRPRAFDKPTIFLTSRVHCGETAGSFFLQGMLDFLSGFSEQAKIMLQKFVFKIIPLLNPDGVERGYWRLDTRGVNLNRVYDNPDP
jgi:hypothetical protein